MSFHRNLKNTTKTLQKILRRNKNIKFSKCIFLSGSDANFNFLRILIF